MKFTVAIIFIYLSFFTSICASSGIKALAYMNGIVSEERSQAVCCRFVAESFRNTCKERGFSTLNEWQKSCRELWKLEYISWCKADSFMKVNNSESKEPLFYGRWIYKGKVYEVYSRGLNND